MFADIHHQQAPQFSHPSFASHDLESYDYGPISRDSFPGNAYTARNDGSPSTGFRNEPQQYALPSQKATSIAARSSLKGCFMNGSNSSEHMLRRKTPSGTLAAGYDGTPVQWDTRQHAAKHFLMPMADVRSDSVYQPVPAMGLDRYTVSNCPLMTARDHGQRLQQQGQPHQEQQYQRWGTYNASHQDKTLAVTAEDDANMARTWPSNKCRFPGMDSVLNQALAPQYSYSFADGQQNPPVLQPMWPPCLGPTSSNEASPYGPYWPDGAFVPYRPAALRDPRYPSLPDEDQPSGHNREQLKDYRHMNWAAARNMSALRQSQGLEGDQLCITVQPQKSSANHGKPTIDGTRRLQTELPSQQRASSFEQKAHLENNQDYPLPLAYRGKQRSENDDEVQRESAQGSPSWTTTAPCSENESSPMYEYGAQSSNAQFKEKVLIWAHRVYMHLLTSLHHSRKVTRSPQDRTDRQHSRSGIYPKPPRHYLSQHSVSRGYGIEASIGLHSHTGTPRSCNEEQTNRNGDYHQIARDTRHDWAPKPAAWSNSQVPLATNCRPLQRLWLPVDQLHITAEPPLEFSRHRQHSMGASKFTARLLTQDLLSSPLSTNAQAALEMLSRLCQESDWEWIDGMLLGGCLAYGLEDYGQAMSWYTRVLSADPV